MVTAAEPDWKGKFFVQDSSAGIFVVYAGPEQPGLGDVVTVEGVSTPGAFAPTVSSSAWKKIGTAELPAAKKVSIEELISGAQDGQRVEIVGYVHSVRRIGPRNIIETAVGGYRLHVLSRFSARNASGLVGARIRVRGTAAAAYNAPLRHLISVNIYVVRPDDLIVETPETADPFDLPLIPLNAVAQYRANASPDGRIHVRGTVTYQRPGQDLFIQDGTGGLRVQTEQALRLLPGDVVEVAGFCEFDHFLPVLRDGEIKPVLGATETPRVSHPTAEALAQGVNYADLISLQGKVIDRTTQRIPGNFGGLSGQRIVWLIQSPALNFQAVLEGPRPGVRDRRRRHRQYGGRQWRLPVGNL